MHNRRTIEKVRRIAVRHARSKGAKLAQRAKKVKVHLKPLLHQAFSNLT